MQIVYRPRRNASRIAYFPLSGIHLKANVIQRLWSDVSVSPSQSSHSFWMSVDERCFIAQWRRWPWFLFQCGETSEQSYHSFTGHVWVLALITQTIINYFNDRGFLTYVSLQIEPCHAEMPPIKSQFIVNTHQPPQWTPLRHLIHHPCYKMLIMSNLY